MPLIKTSNGYRFESTGKEIRDAQFKSLYRSIMVKGVWIPLLQPSERKELAEYMIKRWAEWGGVDIRRIA